MGTEAGNLCSLAVLSYQTGWHHNSKTRTTTIYKKVFHKKSFVLDKNMVLAPRPFQWSRSLEPPVLPK